MASATAIEISLDTERIRAAVIFRLATSPSEPDPFRSGSVTWEMARLTAPNQHHNFGWEAPPGEMLCAECFRVSRQSLTICTNARSHKSGKVSVLSIRCLFGASEQGLERDLVDLGGPTFHASKQ